MRRRFGIGVAIGIGIALVWWLWPGRGAAPARDAARIAGSSIVARTATPPAARPARSAGWRDDRPAGGLRLEGQVVGEAGAGVGGATVVLAGTPPRTTVAEADGSFAFDQLITGAYELQAASGDQIGGPVAYRLTEHSDPVVIRLAPGATVIVTVVDPEHRPVAGAAVHVVDGALEQTVIADGHGTAKVAPVQPAQLRLEVSAEGYAIALASLSVGASSAELDLVVTLRRGVAVSGRVIDEAGRPIAGAQVTPVTRSYDQIEGASAVTAADGAYAIAALAPGAYWLRALDGDHEPARSATLAVRDRPLDHVDLTMRAGGRLAGVVVDPARQPVASARVSIGAPRSEVGGYRQVIADAQGRFEARGLVRGPLRVSGDAAGARAKPIDVDLTARAQAELELVLDLRGTIAGIVVDEHGRPAPETQVVGYPTGRFGAGERVGMTGGDGRFVMRGLEDGDFQLLAQRRPGAPLVHHSDRELGVTAHTGDQQVRLVLERAGRVIGRVVVAGAAAPPRGVLVIVGAHLGSAARDGSFQLDDVSPGSEVLMIRSDDFADVFRKVKVEAGETLDLGTITATRGRTLAGKVVDAAGAPAVGATVRIDPPLGPDGPPLDQLVPMRTVEVAADGSFTVVGLPVAASLVTAEDPVRGVSPSLPVASGAGDPPAITLTVRR